MRSFYRIAVTKIKQKSQNAASFLIFLLHDFYPKTWCFRLFGYFINSDCCQCSNRHYLVVYFQHKLFFIKNASLLINIRFWSISYYQKDYTENITRPRKVGAQSHPRDIQSSRFACPLPLRCRESYAYTLRMFSNFQFLRDVLC